MKIMQITFSITVKSGSTEDFPMDIYAQWWISGSPKVQPLEAIIMEFN